MKVSRSAYETLGGYGTLETAPWLRLLHPRPALRALGALAALGLLLGASSAGGDRPDANMSDEMVGTLPSYDGGGFSVPDSGQLDAGVRAGFYVEGRWQAVVQAALRARGSGHVTFEVMAGEVELRAVFHGELRLALDLETLQTGGAFQTGALRAGLLFSGERGPITIGLIHAGRVATHLAHDTLLELSVPMQHLHDSGALIDGVTLVTSSPSTGRGSVQISQAGGLLDIVQGF